MGRGGGREGFLSRQHLSGCRDNRSSLGKGWGRFQAHAKTGGRRPAGTERGVTEPRLRGGKRGKKRGEGDEHGPGPKVSRLMGGFMCQLG